MAYNKQRKAKLEVKSATFHHDVRSIAREASAAPAALASSTSADLIDSVLAVGIKSGYIFQYTAGTSNQSYTITATPITPGITGQNMFFTDQSGVIRADTSGSGANASSTPIG